MRIWADVFNPQNKKIGVATKLSGAAATRSLDGAGSISLSFSVGDQATFDLLQKENRVRIYVEEDEQPRLLGKGVIREHNLDETNTKVVASGPDELDALSRRSVLLGRSYDDLPISTIAASLTGLVPGWSASVSADGFQTARFDGVNVLAALIRLAEEKGHHVRESLADNVIELGPFGEDSGLVALRPLTITDELSSRDDVLIINTMKRKSSSKKIVNWIVPLGAGEGAAAITLKDSSYTVPSMIGPDGETLYYLFDQDSIDRYGQIEKVVTFKQIIPIANNDTAKQLAADALYEAAIAWLAKNSVPFDTYSLTTKKSRKTLRPGEKVTIRYTGFVETKNGQFTYIDLNDLFWANRVTESASDSGITMQLEVSSVDRQRLDAEGTVGQIVSIKESMDVRNLSLQTFPIGWVTTYYDTLGLSSFLKEAQFKLRVNEYITDIINVTINFVTKPLWTPIMAYATTPMQVVWHMREGYNHPSDVTLWINGVDVSEDYGGPWAEGVNQAIEVTADITDLITQATGGIYQDHTIVLKCGTRLGEVRATESHPSVINTSASTGNVEMTFNVLAVAMALKNS